MSGSRWNSPRTIHSRYKEMDAEVLQIDLGEPAVLVLRKLVEACQTLSLVGVLARRLECSAATVYNWRETKDEETALQRILRIALVKDEDLHGVCSVARHVLMGRIEG